MASTRASQLAQITNVLIVGLIPLQFGLHMSILNAPMDYMGCNGVEEKTQDCIPGWDPALPSSIYAVGGLLGSAGAGYLANHYGLRRVFLLCAGIFVGGSLLVASATTVPHMLVGRIVTGLAAGGSIVVCPILINKLSPPEYRGILGVTTQSTINIGIIVSQLLGIIWAANHWRRIMWGALGISVISIIASIYSARKWHDVGKAGPITPQSAEIEEGVDLHGENDDRNIGILELFTSSRYRYTLITTISIFTVQQLTGINSIIQYGVRILAEVMPDSSKLINMLISVVNLFMTALSGPLMDKYGRKRLLIISLGLMGICTALMGFGLVRGLGGFSAISAISTIAAFAIGIGPIPFMYISEIAPHEALGAAQSLGTVSSWVSTFAILAFFPALQSRLGPSVFYFFSISTLAAAVWYAKWLIPEQN